MPHLELDLHLDPGKRTLTAQATLSFQADSLRFRMVPALRVTGLSVDGRKQPLPGQAGEPIHLVLGGAGPHTLRLAYQGSLSPLADLDQNGVLGRLPPMVDVRGSFLPAGSGWYPDPGEPFSYRLSLHLPPGQMGLAPGTLVKESDGSSGYQAEYAFAHPAEGIDLMAGPYVVREHMIARPGQPPLRLRTWFYQDMTNLAPGYLDDSARYIARYSKFIGPYPFDAFSVVASPLPTGFGMPSIAYLGRDVLRLPFIRATSLGHEVLHNWWGNGVIPDSATGNWSEGLTTFMADYAYQEDQSEEAARAARLAWLRDLAAVPEAADTPLTAFTARHHGISSITGYDKAAMVFFMLRDEIGANAFSSGLRLFWQRYRFQRAGWAELEQTFAEVAGRDLSTFFRQWVQKAGAPRLKLSDARWANGNLDLTVAQEGPTYQLRVPLRLLVYPDQSETCWVQVKKSITRLSLPAPRLVQAVELDPDYRLWRRVEADRFPPILREVFVAPKVGLLTAGNDMAEAANSLAEHLLDTRPEPLQRAGSGLPGNDPVLIVGQTDRVNHLLARLGLAPPPSELAGKGSARVWAARDESGRPYAVVAAQDADALNALQRPLPHYGRQSWLVFDAAKAAAKGIWSARAERIRVKTPAIMPPAAIETNP
ncbi:MAG TPA: M1 family aminopeptidase [Thiobacillaceae bacterium]|nr:M1 family aminopeptidase [Thiobacillaceae bacterium]